MVMVQMTMMMVTMSMMMPTIRMTTRMTTKMATRMMNWWQPVASVAPILGQLLAQVLALQKCYYGFDYDDGMMMLYYYDNGILMILMMVWPVARLASRLYRPVSKSCRTAKLGSYLPFGSWCPSWSYWWSWWWGTLWWWWWTYDRGDDCITSLSLVTFV